MKPHERLEQEWAKFNDLDPEGMVCCSSGTAALHLGLEALQLPKGSEVVMPDYTMVACPRAAVMANLVPVFVDCGDDLLMKIGQAGHECGFRDPQNVKVVMAVHVYGRRVNVENLGEATQVISPVIVEDLAEAHGVKPSPRTDVACWSFYKNKIVAGEEGGAVWFRDNGQSNLARQLRSLGFTEAHDYDHVPRGWNHRLSDMHADWILSRRNVRALWNYEMNKKGRANVVKWYDACCPEKWRMPNRDADWVYDLKVPGMTRDVQLGAVKYLNEKGVAARCGFWPMTSQQEFSGCRVVGSGNAAHIAPTVVYLPVQPETSSEAECRRAMGLLREYVGSR